MVANTVLFKGMRIAVGQVAVVLYKGETRWLQVERVGTSAQGIPYIQGMDVDKAVGEYRTLSEDRAEGVEYVE
jgi:hypothetical protein